MIPGSATYRLLCCGRVFAGCAFVLDWLMSKSGGLDLATGVGGKIEKKEVLSAVENPHLTLIDKQSSASQKGTDGMDITEMGPTLRKADPFDIGGGHVNPNRAINPGLIYNISKQDYIQFIGINPELLVVALVQVNGDQDMFVVSVLLQKKMYRSDLQLAMALQQQEFEQQPQRNVEQPTVSSSSRLVTGPRTSSQKYSPLDWLGYFDQEDDIHILDSNDASHIYKAESDGLIIFCLHGGGYSGLDWGVIFDVQQ